MKDGSNLFPVLIFDVEHGRFVVESPFFRVRSLTLESPIKTELKSRVRVLHVSVRVSQVRVHNPRVRVQVRVPRKTELEWESSPSPSTTSLGHGRFYQILLTGRLPVQ
jgi:hypothetical protein